jgi:hypothetical protein
MIAQLKRRSLVLVSILPFALVKTVYVQDCGEQVAVDLHRNGSLYLKGTDIAFRYGENCH